MGENKDLKIYSFTHNFTVRPDESDRNGIATVRTLGNFFQHTAHLHANSLDFGVDDLGEEGKTWVLARLFLSVNRPPRFSETITVETWPTGIDKLFALRDFRIFDQDGNDLVSGVSAWLIISLEERRIMRIPQSFVEFAKNPRAVDHRLEKIEVSPLSPSAVKNLDVRFRDIDVNQHVNNVSFIEWVTEALPFELQSSSYCCELEINYLKEAFYGDTIESCAVLFSENPDSYFHSLQRKGEGEIARAVTRWKKVESERN
jgi:acyl-ACP thioesterase